jgi:hypothetical protein
MFRAAFAAILIGSSAVITSAQAQPAAQASPVCIYESKSYTDGALICVYRTLMLTCSAEGARATWKAVPDRSLASVCDRAGEGPRVAAPSRPPRRHGIHHPVRMNADRTAKCFVFNGKQYCE